MSDQLVHVRDKTTGEEGYVGAAWLDRWPDDFDRIDEATAPAQTRPAPAVQPAAEPAAPSNTTQF